MSDYSPPPPPTGSVRFDRIASLVAVTLSMAAMLVSVAEVFTVRSQQRAAVWPYVEISTSYSDQGFMIELSNKGVGPALMSDVTFKYKDEPVEDIDALIADTLGPEDAFSYESYSISNPSNSVVAAGETVNLFSVSWDERTRRLVDSWNGLIDIETCFCSINDECWDVSLSAGGTSSSAACQTDVAN